MKTTVTHGTSDDLDAHMATARGMNDIRMNTAKAGTLYKGDIHMETVRGGTTMVKKGGLQLWEREIAESAEVRRKATVAQLCELFS